MSRLQLIAARSPGATAPPVDYLQLTNAVHLHIDANSIYAAWVYAPIQEVGELAALTTATGIGWSNSSIPGQDWRDMASAASDVDAGYVAGKTNVLVIGETTNSIFNDGRSTAQTLGDIEAYLAGRLAANPWEYVVMMGTIPRGGTAGDATNNARLLEVDDTIRADPTAYGLDLFIGYRDLSPFFRDGTTRAGFMTSTLTCLESTAPYIHPVGSARELIAARIADRLQEIPGG